MCVHASCTGSSKNAKHTAHWNSCRSEEEASPAMMSSNLNLPIFRDALPHARVLVAASRYEPFPDRFWTDRDAAPQVVLECAKLAYYALGGRR